VSNYWFDRVANPSNHTWVGVGVDHDSFKETLEQREAKPAPQTLPSTYFGGDISVPLDSNTRMGIIFKGLSENDKDHPALAVLSALTGGATRCSKAGLGRGVTTRLNRNVLEKHSSILSTATINTSYSDNGLWGVYAEAQPGHVPEVAELLVGELGRLKKDTISTIELEGAKNRAKASFLRGLDCPKGLLNYLGRKASAPGAMLTPTDFVSKIDKLTAEDVAKVARSVLSSNPTLVCVGDVDGLPIISK